MLPVHPWNWISSQLTVYCTFNFFRCEIQAFISSSEVALTTSYQPYTETMDEIKIWTYLVLWLNLVATPPLVPCMVCRVNTNEVFDSDFFCRSQDNATLLIAISMMRTVCAPHLNPSRRAPQIANKWWTTASKACREPYPWALPFASAPATTQRSHLPRPAS